MILSAANNYFAETLLDESKKDKLVFGYLAKYEIMEVINENDNYGDLRMMINKENDSTQPDLNEIRELIFNPNSQDMLFIIFESIENPHLVLISAQNARQEILKSNL